MAQAGHGFWTDDDYFTGPPLRDDMVRDAEALLGYALPESYIRLLRSRNGGHASTHLFPYESANLLGQ